MKNLRHVIGLFKAIGLLKGMYVILLRLLRIRCTISARAAGFPLRLRPMDSDLAVLSQVFGWKEYEIDANRLSRLRSVAARWRGEGLVPVIVDAGANVGYSSLYFHSIFPDAVVLAVEPSPTTFSVLQKNVSGHPDIIPINAALWSHANGLALIDGASGSWGDSVEEGNGLPSIRMDTLLSGIKDSKPLLIKMDIEGSEREVIGSCQDVFAEAKCLLIEPHDFDRPGLACLTPLYKCAAQKEFDTVLSGENLAFFASDL